MAVLGYSASKADVEAVFDGLDKDKSGALDYTELNKALRRQDVKLDPKLMAGGAGKIETREDLLAKAKEKPKREGSSSRFKAAC